MTRLSWPRRHSPTATRVEPVNGRVRFAPQERAAAGRARVRSRRVLQPLPLAGVALTLLGVVVMLGYGEGRDGAGVRARRGRPGRVRRAAGGRWWPQWRSTPRSGPVGSGAGQARSGPGQPRVRHSG